MYSEIMYNIYTGKASPYQQLMEKWRKADYKVRKIIW